MFFLFFVACELFAQNAPRPVKHEEHPASDTTQNMADCKDSSRSSLDLARSPDFAQ